MHRVTAQTWDILKPALNLCRLLSCFAHFSRSCLSSGSIFFRHVGKQKNELRLCIVCSPKQRAHSEAVQKRCMLLLNDVWVQQPLTGVLTPLTSLHLCWWKQTPPAYVPHLYFSLLSSGHITFVFIFFSWGFSESPHFQPNFWQKEIKGLKLFNPHVAV